MKFKSILAFLVFFLSFSGWSEDTPVNLYDLPEAWSYANFIDHPAQKMIPSLLGVFDHRDVSSMVVRLHSGRNESAKVVMDQHMKLKLKEGQSSIIISEGVIPGKIDFSIRQRSFGTLPITAAVYHIVINNKHYFLEVDTTSSNFKEHEKYVKDLAQSLHEHSDNRGLASH